MESLKQFIKNLYYSMSKIQGMIGFLVIVCIYAILTIKLGIFWKIGECQKADSINEVIVNLSYSILAAAIFYFIIDFIPFYSKRNKIRRIIFIKMNELRAKIHKAKTAIYIPPFSNMPSSKSDFISDFENKDMTQAYQLGIGGFKNLEHFFAVNKTEIKNLIQDIVAYSEYLYDDEVEILAKINSSKYINHFFFTKDYEMLKIRHDLYDNQKEIGESIYNINELIKRINIPYNERAI